MTKIQNFIHGERVDATYSIGLRVRARDGVVSDVLIDSLAGKAGLAQSGLGNLTVQMSVPARLIGKCIENAEARGVNPKRKPAHRGGLLDG